jgi:multidrug transporter EmrE-like cation transporter
VLRHVPIDCWHGKVVLRSANMTAPPNSQPGWYPDPLNPGKQIYWDGARWGEPADVPTDSSKNKKTAVAIGVCVLAAVGLVMSMQSVSLMTGSGPVWTGVAVVGVATALAFFLGSATWVRVVACVVLALSLVNGFYIESQMSDRRDELTRMFDN